eukprot:943351-Prorocentrum_minimum.AAC.1
MLYARSRTARLASKLNRLRQSRDASAAAVVGLAARAWRPRIIGGRIELSSFKLASRGLNGRF